MARRRFPRSRERRRRVASAGRPSRPGWSSRKSTPTRPAVPRERRRRGAARRRRSLGLAQISLLRPALGDSGCGRRHPHPRRLERNRSASSAARRASRMVWLESSAGGSFWRRPSARSPTRAESSPWPAPRASGAAAASWSACRRRWSRRSRSAPTSTQLACNSPSASPWGPRSRSTSSTTAPSGATQDSRARWSPTHRRSRWHTTTPRPAASPGSSSDSWRDVDDSAAPRGRKRRAEVLDDLAS